MSMNETTLDDLREHPSSERDFVVDAFSVASVSVGRCCGNIKHLNLSNANCTHMNLFNRIEWKVIELSRLF